jgi:hypothetical protein
VLTQELLYSGRLWPYLQTLDKAGKAYVGQTLLLIMKIQELLTEKVYNIGPWTEEIAKDGVVIDPV